MQHTVRPDHRKGQQNYNTIRTNACNEQNKAEPTHQTGAKPCTNKKNTTIHLLYSHERSPEDNTPIDNPVCTEDDAG
jgi:hypothetical protein